MRTTIWQRSAWLGRPLLLTGALLLLLVPLAHAQSNPSVSTTMQSVKDIAVALLRLGMAVGTIVALVKVTRNFLSGNPASVTSILWLLGGVCVFFLWGTFFRDIGGTWSASSGATGTIGNGNLDQGVSNGAYLMAQKILDTMLTTVVPLAMFTTVALTVIRGFISSGSVQFEFGPIVRVVFMYIILVNYNNVVPLVGNAIGGLADKIQGNNESTSAYSVLKQLRDSAEKAKAADGTTLPANPQQAGNGTADEPGLLASLAGKIATELKDKMETFSPRSWITGLATDFITGIIQLIMEFIQSFLLGFLYVAGPIAISLSFIPGFGGLAKSWLQSFISINMWSVAFMVINGLFKYYQAADAALSYSSASSTLQSLTGIAQTKFTVGCIVFIIMYVMVPYMTSLIVGGSGADGFVGSAMRIATTAAAAVATGGVGAVGAAGAGAQAANAAGASGAGFGGQLAAFGRGAGNAIVDSVGKAAGGTENFQAISQMLGGGQSAPPMASAGTQSASGQSHSQSTQAAVAASTPAPPRFAQSSGATMAQQATSVAPQASTAAPAATSGATAAPGYSGGGSGEPGFSAPTVAAPAQPAAVSAEAQGPAAVTAGPPSVVAPTSGGGAAGGFGRRSPRAPAAPGVTRTVAAAPRERLEGQAPPRLHGS